MFKSSLPQKITGMAVVLFLLQGAPLFADNTPPVIDNGSWLEAQCSGFASSPTLSVGNALCVGYIRGVIQSWYTAESQVNPQGAVFWIQEYGSIPSFKSAEMVYNYLHNDPHDLNNSAVSLIIAAVSQAYPIPGGAGSSS